MFHAPGFIDGQNRGAKLLHEFERAVDKTRNMEHSEIFRNIPEHEKKLRYKKIIIIN